MLARLTKYTLCLCIIFAALLQTIPAAAALPNVVVILADDQGWGDLSVQGNKNVATPKIDSLARDGAIFDRFFVCPVCAPTRAEFFTGRYHLRGGVHGVSTGAERLNADEKTIADTFKAAGYATGAFGKWHNGSQWPYHPNARGWDEYYGFTSGHWGHYFDPILEHNGKDVSGKGFIIDDLTNHALQFIEQHKAGPFFCYLPYNTPHSPFQVPDKFWDNKPESSLKMRHRDPQLEDLNVTRCALAMVENIDWNVGRVLDKLEELKLAENTIVIYFSDNGPNSYRWNGGMKGRKGSTDEGGVRVPFMLRWPAQVKAGTKIPHIAAAIDLLPTLADMAGIPIVGNKPLDGRTLKPLLMGTAKAWPDRMIFTHQNGKVSVRTQQYRLDSAGGLFDMQADPEQQTNVAAQHAETTARLQTAVNAWKKDVFLKEKDTRPFPVGYREFPVTWLPARDGIPHGQAKRSGSAPNCSYFTNWKTTTDSLTWDIEVANAGRYEVILYYTCPAADIGSTVEISFLDAKLSGKITPAFDPPLLDQDDRTVRKGESWIKDFSPLRLGTVTLPSGRSLLTLKALDIPGRQVMDLRKVSLTLLPE